MSSSSSLLLAPLILWLCVSLALKLALYGTSHLTLGSSASRLVRASSLLVRHVEAVQRSPKGVTLYAFNEPPQLDDETEINVAKYVVVSPYSRKGFNLWLNRGSTIRATIDGHQLQTIVLKGENKKTTELVTARKVKGLEADYVIEEDDVYFVGLINGNGRKNSATLTLKITLKKYNITTSSSSCSTEHGPCRISLSLPRTNYIVLTTPNNVEYGNTSVEITFIARTLTYITLLLLVSLAFFFTLRCLGACESDHMEIQRVEDRGSTSEALLTVKPSTSFKRVEKSEDQEDEDDDGASSCSSEDLYDAKLCIICYDEQRNCFFIPCGHCATCHECAKRIMEGENKVCPVCRRAIHKARKLFTA